MPQATLDMSPAWIKHPLTLVSTALLLAGLAFVGLNSRPAAAVAPPAPAATVRPALTVSLVSPQRSSLADTVSANGSIAAWQEAIVGAEVQGLRLAEVRVNVGDIVRRGQVLAIFDRRSSEAELAQSRAAVAEAEAALAEAAANAARARELEDSGALSAQQITQLLTAERTAAARLAAVQATQQLQQLRLTQTEVRAPDHGVISARSATVGAVLASGTELFRLIRQGRLEWRGEVAADELAALRPGQTVQVQAPGGATVAGRLRQVGPTVDAATRNALVYVDLPDSAGRLKAGMFARGSFELGRSTALTLPQAAVLLREGFSYVFVLEGADRVAQRKVRTGRRSAEQVEILEGVGPADRVVASGAGFLADGDTVRVVAAPAPAAAGSAPRRND